MIDKDYMLDLEDLDTRKKDKKYKVKIKSVYADEFVIVSGNQYLYATGEQTNKKGIFQLIVKDGKKVKIKQYDGKYIRVNDKGALVADANKDNATVFKYYKMDKKEYALRAPNGYYVRVKDDDKKLVAKAENTGKKTIFKFKEVE